MNDDPTLSFADATLWARWLAENHASSRGVWLALAKKGASHATVTYVEALDEALAWGWIDSQKRPQDESVFLQRFSPRQARSPWSKINREKVAVLTKAGRMEAPGLAEVERAKADGRWEAAYDSAKTSTVPEDPPRPSPRARARRASLRRWTRPIGMRCSIACRRRRSPRRAPGASPSSWPCSPAARRFTR